MRTPTTPVTADAVREAFARRGVIALVQEVQVAGMPAALAVRFRAAWPFPLPDGNMLEAATTVDPWHLGDLEGWVTYALQRAEADLLAALLPTLVDRARLRGVHRAALASFAREVVGRATDGVDGVEHGAAAAFVRWRTEAYTHADQQGDQ